ncbi:MAG TPA: N-acetylmuramic acid 6-phosphate etherase, partial [Limnochordia bacterium]|nr:N-acetylmuramic acid 6-phosphate etherase [Limnochordia bacterium]
TSGRLGVLDAAECPPTFGVPPTLVSGVIAGGEPALTRSMEGVEDDAAAGAADLLAAGAEAGDVVVGLAASGRTPYVLAALQEAKRLGAGTAAISCAPGSPLLTAAEIGICAAVGPEVLTGSTRLKAGTAQKLILNMLSTGGMIALGKVYQNLMVDVAPSNEKLRARAVRIVTDAAGCGDERARALLAEAGGHCKTAIVMALAGCDAAEATRRLAAAGGFVREAVAP